MKKIKIFLPLLLAVVLMGAGCAKSTPPPAATPAPQPSTQGTPTAAEQSASGDEGDHLAKLAGSRVELENKDNLQTGDITFRFNLYGLDGHEFGDKDLKIAHEKKMHFLMVRDDMTGFQHLHPEYIDNKWGVKTTISEAGMYQLYVDIEPNEEKPVVLRVPVKIGSEAAKANFPVPTDNTATNGQYKVTLKTDGSLKTNEHTSLTFVLTKNGQPAADVSPYLGAFGHVVLIRHNDPDDFFHVHPITETKPANGEVAFEAQFPVKGRYTLYAQFNLSGNVKTFPITVDVSTDGQDTEVHKDGE